MKREVISLLDQLEYLPCKMKPKGVQENAEMLM